MCTTDKLRHYCRNPRCRGKLKEPVENLHAAFCTRGCWEQYHMRTQRPIQCSQANCGRLALSGHWDVG